MTLRLTTYPGAVLEGEDVAPKTKYQNMIAPSNVCARHYSLCLAFSDADIEFDFFDQCIQSIYEGQL